ncbi:MAG: hypothetical protein LBQ48_01575, partial [Oscillospiraceae bacterium]|nr:hypothetical protein [Oscillospiraceae bacterium]
MKKQSGKRLIGSLAAAAMIFSVLFAVSIPASANGTADEVCAAARAYVEINKNLVTPEGLLAAVRRAVPSATLRATTSGGTDDSAMLVTGDDFFIKHAVPGVTDDDTTSGYPLDIPGSDGAVAALFEVGGEKIGFAASFPHEKEVLHISSYAIVNPGDSRFTIDAGGYVTAFSGSADKLIFPAGEPNGTGVYGIRGGGDLENDFPNMNQIKAVIFASEGSHPGRTKPFQAQTFYGYNTTTWNKSQWTGLVALDIYRDVDYYASGIADRFSAERIVNGLPSLKYLRLPTVLGQNAVGYNSFAGNSVLENTNIPTSDGGYGNGTFWNNGVRDYFQNNIKSIWGAEPWQAVAKSGSSAFGWPSEPLVAAGGTRNSISPDTPMTLPRAAALAQAKAGELAWSDDLTALSVEAVLKSVITGSDDTTYLTEGTFWEKLTTSWNGTWNSDPDAGLLGGALTLTVGGQSVPVT